MENVPGILMHVKRTCARRVGKDLLAAAARSGQRQRKVVTLRGTYRSRRTLKSVNRFARLAARRICQSVNSPVVAVTKPSGSRYTDRPPKIGLHVPSGAPFARTSAGILSSSLHMSHQLLLTTSETRHEW